MNGLGGNAGSGTIGTLGVVDVQGEWFGGCGDPVEWTGGN
jgi:hypothetical protein